QAGLVAVNTNPLYTPRELEHQLKDSGTTAIIVWKKRREEKRREEKVFWGLDSFSTPYSV
ncbi:hypothetical protein, partial [Neisseria meningitidis]|uniref:hypothetical protein n=1 Tax=Neisseria meningitidis TaxID=487 RepID=UPI0018CBBC90